MIAPEVPAGGLIRQAILHDESHGERNDAMGVMGLRQGIFRRIRVKESVARGTAVLRVDQFNVARPTRNEVAHIMEYPGAHSISETRLAAPRTGKMGIIPAASDDLCFGQMFRARDTLGRVRQILTGTEHGNALLGQVSSAQNLRHLLVGVAVTFHALMLKTPKVTQIRQQAVTVLDEMHRWKEDELKQHQADVEKAAQKLLGGVGPLQVMSNIVEHDFAELLSNPRLEAAIAGRLKGKK